MTVTTAIVAMLLVRFSLRSTDSWRWWELSFIGGALTLVFISWFHNQLAPHGRNLEAAALGIILGSYFSSLLRLLVVSAPEKKWNQLLFKLTLLLGMICFSLTNLVSFSITLVFYVGALCLGVLLVYSVALLKPYFYTHILSSLFSLLAISLSRSELVPLEWLHPLASLFFLLGMIYMSYIVSKASS